MNGALASQFLFHHVARNKTRTGRAQSVGHAHFVLTRLVMTFYSDARVNKHTLFILGTMRKTFYIAEEETADRGTYL